MSIDAEVKNVKEILQLSFPVEVCICAYLLKEFPSSYLVADVEIDLRLSKLRCLQACVRAGGYVTGAPEGYMKASTQVPNHVSRGTYMYQQKKFKTDFVVLLNLHKEAMPF